MAMRIHVLAYEGCLGGEIFGFCDVLFFANRRLAADRKAPVFQVEVATISGGPVTTASSASVGPTAALDERADLLVLPGCDLPRRSSYARDVARWKAETDHVRAVLAAGGRVASICVGAFLLGEAGALDGRRCTTAWAYADRLARTYPKAVVQPRALLMDDGPVSTTGAFSAAYDLALKLTRETAGEETARAVMRLALLEGRASQSAFADERLDAGEGGGFSREVTAFMTARLAHPYDLEALAKAFGMSSRTLLRKFKAETGRSPLHALQAARLERAKRLLADTRLPVAEITARVGYEDASSFQTLFATRVGETPAAYRRRFQT